MRTLKTRKHARDAIGSALCVVNAVTVHYSKVQSLEYAELLNSQVQQTQDFEERLKEGIAGMNNGKY